MAGGDTKIPKLPGVRTRTGGSQSTLDKSLRKVTFGKGDEETLGGKVKEMSREIGRLREMMEAEGKERAKLAGRVAKLEERYLKLEGERVQDRKDNIEWVKGMEEIRERLVSLEGRMVDLLNSLACGGAEGSEGEATSNSASVSVGMGAGSRRASAWSLYSGASGFTDREVSGLRQMMLERDRRGREDNIVIRGLGEEDCAGGDLVKLAEDFLRSKIGVNAEVSGARRSGAVLVVRLKTRESKVEVMRSKNRLKGSPFLLSTI